MSEATINRVVWAVMIPLWLFGVMLCRYSGETQWEQIDKLLRYRRDSDSIDNDTFAALISVIIRVYRM